MSTFSHSGTTGDTFCSLVAAKILGGGEFYLRLNNLENVVREKLGWALTELLLDKLTMYRAFRLITLL
jgi:hypothetical protein